MEFEWEWDLMIEDVSTPHGSVAPETTAVPMILHLPFVMSHLHGMHMKSSMRFHHK